MATMKLVSIALLALALGLAGCGDTKSKLAGTWKARAVENKPSQNLGDVMTNSFLSLAAQNLVLEFTDKGDFKFSQAMGSGTGTYKVNGSKIELTFNSFAPQRPLVLELKGNTLEIERKFDSDPTVYFDKQK